MTEKIIPVTRQDIVRRLREVLRSGREERREITLEAKNTDDTACLDASGAIRLSIQDILPTAENSLGLPPGLEVDFGVEGNEVHPVSINDVEMEEEDETVTLTDQKLGFALVPTSAPSSMGIILEVSNAAIDSAGFDLLGFIREKFRLAERRYIAAHLYSNASWEGLNGPFSTVNSSQWSVPAGRMYDGIMKQITVLEDAGYDTSEVVIVMDFDMETKLKYTPTVDGEGHMMIENGKCCGYNYVANGYFNTELDATTGKLVRRSVDTIGIALFKYFKVSQHGTARLIIDGVSTEVAKRNITTITLRTGWSFTDVSKKINGGACRAFHTLQQSVLALADADGNVLADVDGYILTVTP